MTTSTMIGLKEKRVRLGCAPLKWQFSEDSIWMRNETFGTIQGNVEALVCSDHLCNHPALIKEDEPAAADRHKALRNEGVIKLLGRLFIILPLLVSCQCVILSLFQLSFHYSSVLFEMC